MVGEFAGLSVVLVTVCVVAGVAAGTAAGVAADVVAGSCVRAFLAGCLGSDLLCTKVGNGLRGLKLFVVSGAPLFSQRREICLSPPHLKHLTVVSVDMYTWWLLPEYVKVIVLGGVTFWGIST